MLRRHRQRLRFLAFVAAGLAGADCDNHTPAPTLWKGELRAAEQRWQAAGITDYRYIVAVACRCAPPRTRPVIATVRGDVSVSLVYLDSETVADATVFGIYSTMGRIFGMLHNALVVPPYHFAAEYDPTLGYPTHWEIGGIGTTPGGDVSVTVVGFERLGAGTDVSRWWPERQTPTR